MGIEEWNGMGVSYLVVFVMHGLGTEVRLIRHWLALLFLSSLRRSFSEAASEVAGEA